MSRVLVISNEDFDTKSAEKFLNINLQSHIQLKHSLSEVENLRETFQYVIVYNIPQPEKLFPLVQPGGKLLQVFANVDESNILDQTLIVGFVNITQEWINGVKYIISEKPNYVIGTAQSLKTREIVKQKVWAMDDTFDEDIIDEDLLLDEVDRLQKSQSVADDCEVTDNKRTPCKNCSCGRSTLTDEDLINPKSSCGNCYLGDAFRCPTCPYRGLPAFKPGEKITLTV